MDETLPPSGRGPAYGDGRVYAFGAATMYATDAKTGELVESFGDGGQLDISSKALQFQYPDTYPANFDAYSLGYQLTTPPVYFDNTLFAGVVLSENHIPGGLVIAADATTGAIKWVFNSMPQGPRNDGWEIVKDTWGDGQKVGGGIWTPPAIDPELGLVYVNAGNPSPDYDGSARPGMNLFTNATIALDLKTETLAWYYQTVHHDLWDWDHVTGPILFDVTKDGRVIKGVAMTLFCATYPLIEDPALVERGRQMYTPYSTTEFVIVLQGGGSWGPPAFSPRTGLLYVTGKNGAVSFTVNPVGDTLEPGSNNQGQQRRDRRGRLPEHDTDQNCGCLRPRHQRAGLAADGASQLPHFEQRQPRDGRRSRVPGHVDR